jgi:hypothetical protein
MGAISFDPAITTTPFDFEEEKKDVGFSSVNFVEILRRIADAVQTQGIRSAANSHRNTSEVKQKISQESKAGAELQKKIGNAAFYTAIFGLACALFQLSPERQAVQNVAKWAGEQGTQMANNMYTNFKMSEKSIHDAKLNMHQTSYTAIASKDPGANTQQVVQGLNDVSQNIYQRVAAQAG